jgi:predicted peptidase
MAMSLLKKIVGGRFLYMIMVSALMLLTQCGGDSEPDAAPPTDDLTSLPKDTGGTHTPFVVGSTSSPLGYYLYLPGGYDKVNTPYPLLVFLHGKPERGDGTSSQAVLDKVLVNGPPKLIKAKTWNPKFPMIVASPQFHKLDATENANNWGGGNPEHLRAFIEHLSKTYRVDKTRIYLTGLSHGGNGVYDYLTKQDESTSMIAAAAPVAAYGATGGFSKSKSLPIWVFVGDQDVTNFNTSKNFITNYNSQTPAPLHKAKISVFKNAGHDVWTRTYSGSGIGTSDPGYDAFNISLYEWLLEQKREQ